MTPIAQATPDPGGAFESHVAPAGGVELPSTAARATPPEVWGGVECSVIRTRDGYVDQLVLSGHDRRPSDLDRFAELGLRALRYPVLWERTAPDGPASADWSWADDRLGRLRTLNLRPIVGLVHHGGGPPGTSLLAPGFAEGLAQYALAVARRYPWLDAYTPVNEPLTTARFSGLYGHWHPHGRDDRTFATALLNECRGVVLAMRAVRSVNSDAKLVQTEDLGRVSGTDVLKYQVDFENERRWLTFDLLCGRVGPGRPMWDYLLWAGVPADEIRWFLDNPCPPDVFGINHYLTSDRFLDHRVELYPPHVRGGNHRHAYADVETVRVHPGGPPGPKRLLREAWRRYGRPLAVTEAHLGCTREDQLRWLAQVWDAARGLRAEGADVVAVTAWSLLGSHDWDSLVTRPSGRYEPGVFDLRGPEPRPTALAKLVRALATDGVADHPVLAHPGWWSRPERLIYPAPAESVPPPPRSTAKPARIRPLLIAGGAGRLGRAFAAACSRRGLPHVVAARPEMDVADVRSVLEAVDRFRPWAVVNAAGDGRVDRAERSPIRFRRDNVEGPAILAKVCSQKGIRLLTFSSDQVFDGRRTEPYDESDAIAPINEFGRSKAEAERRTLAAMADALVIRTCELFGGGDGEDRLAAILRALAAGGAVETEDDVTNSPTYAPDLAEASLDLLIDEEAGVWHLVNEGRIGWVELARLAAARAGLDPGRISARLGPSPVVRPAFSALVSRRGSVMPTLQEALGRCLRDGARRSSGVT